MSIKILTITLGILVVTTQAQQRCSIRVSDSRLKEQHLHAANLALELNLKGAESRLQIENVGTEAVDGIFAIVEFKKSSTYLFSTIFFASTAERPGLSPIPLSTSFNPLQRLSESLLPKEIVTLESASPWSVSECPETAEITFLRSTYKNRFRTSHSSWRSDPIPVSGAFFSTCTERISAEDLLVQLSVGKDGEPTIIRIEGESSDADQQRVLQGLRKWRFIPAYFNGSEIASKMALIVNKRSLADLGTTNLAAVIQEASAPPPLTDELFFFGNIPIANRSCPVRKADGAGGPH